MAKRRRKKRAAPRPTRKGAASKGYVTIRNRSYGNQFKGTKIFYEGRKPKGLKPDGRILLGKHILETLKVKFGNQRFRWIITPSTTAITQERGINRVRMAESALKAMWKKSNDRTRDIKHDIVAETFPALYPETFPKRATTPYVPGVLARVLEGNVIPRLSNEDRAAMTKFLPDFVASESIASVNLIKARAQIQSLRELEKEFAAALDEGYGESWWQKFIKANILIIQQGYIAAIEKLNVALGVTKYPDFLLATHDRYLDILEIKTPTTPLLKHDKSRDNYYWDAETSRAIIQVENYLENLQKDDAVICRHIKDRYDLDLRAIRPRGIVLAGDSRKFSTTKEKDDFRRLSAATRNISFLTYDELLSRLRNYIRILEERSKGAGKQLKGKIAKARKR